MSKSRTLLLISVFLIAFCLTLSAAEPSYAQTEDDVDKEEPDDSSVSDDDFSLPSLSGSLDERIEQLQIHIDKVQAKVDDLVFAKENEKREKLKREVRFLKRKLKQLLIERNLANRSSAEVGIEKIRNDYGRKIAAIEAHKAATRRKTITEFESLLSRTPESASKATIVFRLGLLYFEDDHYNYEQAQQRYLESVSDLVDDGGDMDIGSEPMADYSRAQGRFQEVIDQYPYFARADFAYYMLAYCLTEQNDLLGAIEIYKQLIAKFPQSEFVPESHVRMGELYFDENQMSLAIAEYNKVLKFPNSKFYDKALFKLGWSYYRLTAGDPEQLSTAVDYFTKVLEFYATRPTASLRGGDDLRQESVDYIAISFTDMDDKGYPMAIKFIEAHKNYKWNKDILSKMGDVYFERDRYDEAKLIIEERIRRWPNDPDNPKIHMKVVDALITLGRYEDAIAVGEQIAGLYGPDSEWAKANSGKSTVISRTQKQRAKLLFASATFHHENAQRDKRENGMDSAGPKFERAAVSYEQFLASFPDAKDSYEASFNLGECYFEIQNYQKAVIHYGKVVAMRKDKDLFKSAVKNVVYAREQIFTANPGWPVKPPPPGDNGAAEDGKGERVTINKAPLSPQAQAWITSLEQHIKLLPDDKDNPTIMFKIGELYFYHGHFNESVTVLKEQIRIYPRSEAAQVSMNLVIDALDRGGKYEELKTVATDYRNAGATNVEKLEKIQVGAGLKIAEEKIKEGKHQEGINAYLTLVNESPKSERAPIALHNAAATYVDMGKIHEANELYLRVAREYPKFEKAKQDLFFAANNYQKLVDFDNAVDTYELYFNTYSDDEHAKDALYNAALLRENNKEYQEAINLYREYVRRYPDMPDVAETAYSIVRLMLEDGNDSGAEAELANYTNTYNDAVLLTRAYLEWGKLAEKRGDSEGAVRHYRQSAAVYIQAAQIDPTAGGKYAAEAKFHIVDIDYNAFKIIKLNDQKNMENDLLAKAEAYKELNVKYKEILDLGDFEWATASLHMIGMINKEFAETLFSAPVPADLTPEQQDLYIVKLEEMAFPLKNKAIQAFQTNIDKGASSKIRNKWIDMSYDEIKIYKPEIEEEKYELFSFEATTSLPAPSFNMTSPPGTGDGSTGGTP